MPQMQAAIIPRKPILAVLKFTMSGFSLLSILIRLIKDLISLKKSLKSAKKIGEILGENIVKID